jgi:hypothetical protein
MTKKTTKARMKVARVDFRAWASETRPRPGSSCSVCARKDIKEAVHTCLSVWAEGHGTPSYNALHRVLQSQFNFPRSCRALRDHIQNHETKLWNSIRELRL